MGTKLLLVGERNPYSASEDDALLPWPPQSAGARFRGYLGMSEDEYLASFPLRRNLLRRSEREWAAPDAVRAATNLIAEHQPEVVLALGRKVALAFARAVKCAVPEPFGIVSAGLRRSVERVEFAGLLGPAGRPAYAPGPVVAVFRLAAIPHPSGRCRVWNEPGTREKARALVRELLAGRA